MNMMFVQHSLPAYDTGMTLIKGYSTKSAVIQINVDVTVFNVMCWPRIILVFQSSYDSCNTLTPCGFFNLEIEQDRFPRNV